MAWMVLPSRLMLSKSLRACTVTACVWLALAASPARAQFFDPVPAGQASPSAGDLPVQTTPQVAGLLEDAANGLVRDVRPASFKEVTPGQTRLAELKRAWGEPDRQVTQNGVTTLIYKIEPFSSVEFAVSGGVATSIVVHLNGPSSPEEIVKELNLGAFQPAPIPDRSGQVLGQVFPERGILFGFAPDTEKLQVTYLLLEPITAEPFILRALHDFDHRYQQNLADLEYARRLGPKDARIFALKAKLLMNTGRFSEAFTHAQEAVRLDAAAVQYRLLRVQLLAETGKYEQAIQETLELLNAPGMPAELQARAQCQLGDLMAAGPARDFREAIQHHQAAIKLAAPLVGNEQFAVRRAAKQVLVDAHLGVALDISSGAWRKKTEVVPQWISTAETVANDMLQNDHGDESLRLLVYRKALAAYAGANGELDAGAAAQAALKEGRRLIAAAGDPLYKRQLEWELGEALFDAARVLQTRSEFDESLKYANEALVLLQRASADREATARQDYLFGRLYFLIGAVQAVHKNDHVQAVAWYEKAAPRLSRPLPSWAPADAALHGERFISMGVSYWQTGSREPAMQLTKQGMSIIEQAVADNVTDASALSIPYGNLASMHKQLGNDNDARQFAEMAAKVKTPGTVVPR
jgi:tetratricopeptide (TPR) repeat protein